MVTIEKVSKRFGETEAVKECSLTIKDGELFGLIGPDGAGKTTLLRMITSLYVTDEGTIDLWGLDPGKDYQKVREIIGYMPGRFSLYMDLSVEENLEFFATVFNTTIQENYHLIKEIYQQIEPFKTRRAGALSGGMKQKLALSCALIHKPKLLVLDEPTTGVDAVSRKEFWEMLKRLKSAGITIIVSTPYMDEATLCDRVVLMQKGEILNIATPADIVAQFSKKLWAIKATHTHKLLTDLQNYPNTASIYTFGEYLHYTDVREGDETESIMKYLTEQQHSNIEITQIEPNIEDSFMDLLTKKNTSIG